MLGRALVARLLAKKHEVVGVSKSRRLVATPPGVMSVQPPLVTLVRFHHLVLAAASTRTTCLVPTAIARVADGSMIGMGVDARSAT